MTKKELMEQLKNVPDDAKILVNSMYHEGEYIKVDVIDCRYHDNHVVFDLECVAVPQETFRQQK